MTIKQPILFVSIVLAAGIIFCSSIPVKSDPLKIFVSILPLEYFVERIGGNRVKVASLVQPGHSPATYAPTPQQMALLANSQIYFRIGVPFENGLIPKLARSAPEMSIIDLRQGIKLLPMEDSYDEHEDDHGEIDPHTWLDPMLALKQSSEILNTLKRFDPAGSIEYERNFNSLATEIIQLDQQLKELFKPFAGSVIYVFHPAYGYFCQAYGLKQKAINPGGKEPGARHLARLIEQGRKDRTKVIFIQPQFSDKTARTMARSLNGHVATLDPLAKNYLENMRSMARELASSLSSNNQDIHKEKP